MTCQYSSLFGNLLDKLGKRGIAAKNVQIDFASRQKPTSVVAAVVTFFSNAANQYDTTHSKDWNVPKLEYEVLGYNVARCAKQATELPF